MTVKGIKKIKNKHWWSLGAMLACIGLIFLVPNIANAAWDDAVASFVGAFVAVIIWILGKLLVGIIYLVIWVAQYNDFISSPAVAIGWTIVRDVCNMFFILILLIIAFATILNIEKYSWKHLLPKLLLMAVLINFSKLICGVIIDFAQVVMMTFVNGFRDIAGGNFGSMFGINGLLNISGDSGKVELLSIAGTYILAVLYVLVALVVITVILFVLVIRIVMLWILVTLSPLAYLLSSTPSTEKYASDWWKQFTNNVVAGPILAFFIWLSFATMQNNTAEGLFGKPPNQGTDSEYYSTISTKAQEATPTVGLATAGTPEGMLKFIISIGLLVGGLMITKQIGGTVGDIAGKGIGAINKGAQGIKNFGATTAKNAGRFTAQSSLRAAGSSSRGIGNFISRKTGGKYGESLQKSGQFLNSWGGDIRKTRKDERIKKRKATLEKLGMKEQTMDYGKAALDTQLGRSIKGSLKSVAGLAMMTNPVTFSGGVGMLALGAAQLGGGLGSKFVGKNVKDWSVRRQRDKNVDRGYEARDTIYKGKAKEKDDLLKAYEAPARAEIKKREASRDKALRGVEDQLKTDVRNAKNRNAPESEINKFYDEAQKKRTKIKMDADVDISKLKTDLENRSKAAKITIDADVEARYKPLTDSVAKFTKENEDGRKYDTYTRRNEGAKERALERHRKESKEAIKAVEKEYSDAPALVRDQAIANKQAELAKEKERITQRYDERITESRKGVNSVEVKGGAKFVHKRGESIEGYNPNQLTIDAMKLGAKEFDTARTTVANLQKDNVWDFDKPTWSNPMGINSQQEKVLTILGDNSADSKKALQNMISTLSSRNVDKDKLNAMMKGVAHIKAKKPETSSAYAAFISAMESIHPDGTKVDSFKPKK